MKWTRGEAHKYALQCTTRGEFIKRFPRAYSASLYNGWLDELCCHMVSGNKKTWTKDVVMAAAKTYSTRVAFKRSCAAAYDAACRHGWLGDVCVHMKAVDRRYWTFERVELAARPYSTRSAFKHQQPCAYVTATTYGWTDAVCSHMKFQGSSVKRYVYTYRSSSANLAYVGLTYSPRKRLYQHKTSDRMRALLSQNDCVHSISEIMSLEDAVQLERTTIRELSSAGYSMLNITKGGEIGSSAFKRERIYREAKKYATRTKFAKGSACAYRAAIAHRVIDDACAHMPKPTPRITKEAVMEAAKKCTTYREFYLKNGSLYHRARANRWIDAVKMVLPPERQSTGKDRSDAIIEGREK